jgi:hypothetical protein
MANLVKCPVCEEEVDLDDKKKALEHIGKDQAHKDHAASSTAAGFLRMACDSGIMREVRR